MPTIRQAEQILWLGLAVVFIMTVLLYRMSALDLGRTASTMKESFHRCHETSTTTTTLYTKGYVQKHGFSDWELTYYGPDKGIFDFDATKFPVLPSDSWSASRPIRTRLFTEKFKNRAIPMNECKHILNDGLENSEVINLLGVTFTQRDSVTRGNVDETFHKDELWVLDIHHLLPSCNVLEEMMRKTLELRNNAPWKVLAVDYADGRDINDCPGLQHVIGRENYRFAKRSIVVNRTWSEEEQFPVKGNLLVQPQDLFGGPILHMPYPVRTDVVQSVMSTLKERALSTPLETQRQVDAAHFYHRQSKDPTKAYYDNLRNGINIAMRLLDGQPMPNRKPLRMFAGLVGEDKKNGRNNVSPQYIEMLLSSKIVVVSQRDVWVDHYRLLEGLASGAMVFADETQILPRGLRDGESVVVFRSFSDLREKLLYYLDPANTSERKAIAKRGWEVAIKYHRAWHLMETAIFGEPITKATDPYTSFAKEMASLQEQPSHDQ